MIILVASIVAVYLLVGYVAILFIEPAHPRSRERTMFMGIYFLPLLLIFYLYEFIRYKLLKKEPTKWEDLKPADPGPRKKKK